VHARMQGDIVVDFEKIEVSCLKVHGLEWRWTSRAFLGAQKAHHVGDSLRRPYPFRDMTSNGKPHLMGSLSVTGFFAMPPIAQWFRLLLLI